MKNFLQLFTITLITLLLSSCSAIAGIFKVGMGFGIFIAIAVVIIIVVIAMRSSKK